MSHHFLLPVQCSPPPPFRPLHSESSNTFLLCPDSPIQPAVSCTERAKLWCIYLWRKAADGNTHEEGPLNSHTSWQWEQEVNPKSSEFSASTELRLMAWHQVVQKPVLHHASASAALQEPWGAQVAALPELAQTQSYKCSDVILKMSQVKKKWKVVLAFCKTSGYVVRKV